MLIIALERITKLHASGKLNNQRARNPLNAEKSPRTVLHGFDCKPPPPKYEEKPKWNYPESDWGLMAKFSSQRSIYEAIYERERSQKRIEQEISQLREKNLEIIEKEIKKRQDNLEREKFERHQRDEEFERLEEMLSNPQKYSHIHAATNEGIPQSKQQNLDGHLLKDLHLHQPHLSEPSTPPARRFNPEKLNMQESSLFNKFGRSSRNQELLDKALTYALPHKNPPQIKSVNGNSDNSLLQIKKRTKRNLEVYEKNLLNNYQSLTEIPVANIRSLQETHPEVLAKYRTERAAEFIAKQGSSALKPPSHRLDIGTVAFRPGGILPAKSSSTPSNGKAKVRSSSEVPLPIEILSEELKKTESDIALQKLRIGLNSKPPKHYEKTKAKSQR